jgi:hypothetical protein
MLHLSVTDRQTDGLFPYTARSSPHFTKSHQNIPTRSTADGPDLLPTVCVPTLRTPLLTKCSGVVQSTQTTLNIQHRYSF